MHPRPQPPPCPQQATTHWSGTSWRLSGAEEVLWGRLQGYGRNGRSIRGKVPSSLPGRSSPALCDVRHRKRRVRARRWGRSTARLVADRPRNGLDQRCIRREGGRGSGFQKWPKSIFPFINFSFSHHEIWVRVGGGGEPPPMAVSRSNTSLASTHRRSHLLAVQEGVYFDLIDCRGDRRVGLELFIILDGVVTETDRSHLMHRSTGAEGQRGTGKSGRIATSPSQRVPTQSVTCLHHNAANVVDTQATPWLQYPPRGRGGGGRTELE